ncbi:cytochrome b/b6 domain-containing protein [Radiobacillus kanasensis]|uniref:cytochrome b/b6 domain-containing protein n=1 Tax=Radiobacillus kanasensis TaxID=2844358 RepID=UPI001E60EC80|nr:cytochrome b/b6 domain-containing protein [Radiobacillus kanasensis]UFT98651.1 cytochrome b/b6 domain-containing protein [Radiobacillus kanasensis]
MSKRKRNPPFDMMLHWISAILVFLLMISGMSIIGAKFSWIFGDHFALADITHRIVGVFWVLWMLVIVCYEVYQMVTSKIPKRRWIPIGMKGFGGFNLTTSLLMIFSGFLLWFLPSVPFIYATFAFAIHEFFAFFLLFAIVWHIIKKRHVFRVTIFRKKSGK